MKLKIRNHKYKIAIKKSQIISYKYEIENKKSQIRNN